MAEENDLEKTEQPSARRIEQAREEGQIPQSRELASFLVLLAGVSVLMVTGGWMGERIARLVQTVWSFGTERAFEVTTLLALLPYVVKETLLALSPLFVFLLVAAVAGHVAVGGFLFVPKLLAPKWSRLNPMLGIKRVFSLNGLVELAKAVAKTALVGVVAWWTLTSETERVLALIRMPLEHAAAQFIDALGWDTLWLVGAIALIAAADVPYQLWSYTKSLRMTKEELKQEYKETEGDPQLKGRIRAVQREMARRRMMAEVPKATVVVTNPTHFAVALRYDPQKMAAPVVVAKGRGAVALKIRELAEANAVPRVEAPALARSLYVHTEVGEAIPAGLYAAVAEVLAYVYQLDQWMARGGPKPQLPPELEIPEPLYVPPPEEATEAFVRRS
ncbi:flagellar biosynthesis protein FlhB [Hydrogenophilus thiooxidans]|uniref:flagellar biosynthesis protein FlhB n=1 Tax=Hydrogenophilus thiooxidans TaxID=2820326 RepID=UPI0020180BD3|nr:flagellar biosynthesis protein FlhB [Hydrogenophilus thiooxidans]